MTEIPIVLTVGHSTHTWDVFLDLLRAHGVRRVIDVWRYFVQSLQSIRKDFEMLIHLARR